MIKVLMVEDNDREAEYLRGLLDPHLGVFELVGRASDVATGIELLNTLTPDVLFLDVELPDGTGFDVLEEFPDRTFQVVFITGHDHYSIRALRVAAFDYLQKPVMREDFDHMLTRVRSYQAEALSKRLGVLPRDGKYHRLAIRNTEGLTLLGLEDIKYIEGDGSYSTFYCSDGSKLVVARVLKDYAFLCEDQLFVRCHRSYVVNVSWVSGYTGMSGHPITLRDNTQIPVSRSRREEVRLALARHSRGR